MMIRSYGSDNDVFISEHNSIKIHNINSRVDTSKEFIGDNEFGKNRIMYSKQSSFCFMPDKTHIATKDIMSITIDKDTGEIVKYGSLVSWPFGIYPSTHQYGFINDVSFDVKNINDYSKFTIANALVEDNSSLCNITTCFEDEFQLKYLPVAGMFLSFFSTIALNYPYVAQFVFDSKVGFNIVNVYANDTYIDLVKSKIYSYRPLIANLFLDFKEECEKEKRHIRTYVLVHEWGVVVKIVDSVYKMSMDYHLNLSDNCRTLQANEYYNSKEYGSSNLLHNLLKLGIPTVLETLGSVSTEGENDD
jgi:hypothetical protein